MVAWIIGVFRSIPGGRAGFPSRFREESTSTKLALIRFFVSREGNAFSRLDVDGERLVELAENERELVASFIAAARVLCVRSSFPEAEMVCGSREDFVVCSR